RRNRHARPGDHRLLAGDLRHVGGGVLEHLLVGRSLAHAHVERDLADLRHLHRIRVAELLHQLRHHFFLVERFQSAHFFIPQASSASPLERNTRIRPPSSTTLVPMRSPLPVAGLNGITLAPLIVASRSITPPGCPAWGLGLVWRLTMLTLETITRSPSTRITSPRLPLSLPATTITWSPFLIRLVAIIPVLRSQHFGSERDDLHELLGAQLARHRPEDAGADRLVLGVEKHGGIAVEADQRAVRAAHALAGTHHHGVVDLALLHLAARDRFLHRHLDDVADRGVAALGAAEHLDAHHFPGAGVVCHVEVAFGLDHFSAPVLLGRARDDFDHAPVLGLGHRRDLHHADGVALVAGVVGVVGVQLAGTADVLAVQRVLDLALDQDRHGLVHLVADHPAFDRAQLLLGVLSHRRPSYSCAPGLAWPSSMLTRAISRRTRRA